MSSNKTCHFAVFLSELHLTVVYMHAVMESVVGEMCNCFRVTLALKDVKQASASM